MTSNPRGLLITREQAIRVLLGGFLVGCVMPIEPPTPTGDVLDALRTAQALLLSLSDAHPKNLLLKEAVGAVEMALTTVTEFNELTGG